MIDISNLSQFTAQLDQFADGVEQSVESVAEALAHEALVYLVNHSAQYSGDFTANWNYSVGIPNTSWKEDIFNLNASEPVIMGHGRAISYAMSKKRKDYRPIVLGETIYLTNGSQHDQAYAQMIEDNQIDFRPGNSGAPMARTIEYIASRYSALTTLETARLIQKGKRFV